MTNAPDARDEERARAKARTSAGEDDPDTTAISEDVPGAGEDAVIVDDNPETLIDERRGSDHPRPFGSPGRPLQRKTPFYFGFFGALGVILAYVLAQAVVAASQVLLLVVVSMFLAIGLNPLVERLIRAGLHRGPAVGVVFLGTILAVVGIGYAIIPPVLDETTQFVQALPANIDHLRKSETINGLNERYGVLDSLQAYVNSGNLNATNIGARVAGGVIGLGRFVLGALFATLTVLILTLYFLAALPSIKRQVYALVPASRRRRVTFLGDEILLRIGGYVSGMVTVALIAGIAAYTFLRIIDVPFALPLAIVAGALSLIPMIGATLALILLATTAFFTSVGAGIATIAFYLVYQQVENYFIYPRVMRRTVDVPPAVTVVAALSGGALMGIVGALLAIPIAAAIQLIMIEVIIPRQDAH